MSTRRRLPNRWELPLVCSLHPRTASFMSIGLTGVCWIKFDYDWSKFGLSLYSSRNSVKQHDWFIAVSVNRVFAYHWVNLENGRYSGWSLLDLGNDHCAAQTYGIPMDESCQPVWSKSAFTFMKCKLWLGVKPLHMRSRLFVYFLDVLVLYYKRAESWIVKQ